MPIIKKPKRQPSSAFTMSSSKIEKYESLIDLSSFEPRNNETRKNYLTRLCNEFNEKFKGQGFPTLVRDYGTFCIETSIPEDVYDFIEYNANEYCMAGMLSRDEGYHVAILRDDDEVVCKGKMSDYNGIMIGKAIEIISSISKFKNYIEESGLNVEEEMNAILKEAEKSLNSIENQNEIVSLFSEIDKENLADSEYRVQKYKNDNYDFEELMNLEKSKAFEEINELKSSINKEELDKSEIEIEY